ncbi:hypothetical protein BaRGS_00024930, partial [Batillaria attramentaria]
MRKQENDDITMAPVIPEGKYCHPVWVFFSTVQAHSTHFYDWITSGAEFTEELL